MSARADARALLAAALMIAESDLPPDPRLGQVEGWDSLAHTRLLMALEEKLARQLSADEAVAVETLDDIAGLIGRS
jgi:acyl carrier protein